MTLMNEYITRHNNVDAADDDDDDDAGRNVICVWTSDT